MAMAAYEDAYKQTLRETEDPRAMERRVFAQITGELEAAEAIDEGPAKTRALNEAVGRNQKLWNMILFDLAEPGNQLPKALRAQLISFALFVDRHTVEALARRGSVRALIDVNRRIMLGLAGVRPQAHDSGAVAPAAQSLSVAGGAHGTAHPA